MKTISTIGVLFLSLSIFAQEAGKAGELLRNDAKSTEMQTPRNNTSAKTNDKVLDNSKYRNPTKTTSSQPISNNDYRWNYNYGNSEVFLRIPQNGNDTVEVGDQMMSNSTGKFRFFDVQFGTVPIAIYENNFLIYRTNLRLQTYTRLVLDFFPNKGLYLLGNYPVENNLYGITEWDDIWNNPYGNQNGYWNGNSGYSGNVMNNQDFSSFISSVKRSGSFDKDKMSVIKMTARNANFTSQQSYSLLKTMDFDDNKLEVAKLLYTRCVDRQNFYLVFEAFDFSASKIKLTDFISKYR